jgi:hypothetical protein
LADRENAGRMGSQARRLFGDGSTGNGGWAAFDRKAQCIAGRLSDNTTDKTAFYDITSS